MSTRIAFTVDISPLRRDQWRFWFNEHAHAIVLDEYVVEERPSLRHKFREVGSYERLRGQRHSGTASDIREGDVPLTPIIAQRALDEFTRDLRVGLASHIMKR
jgi:hypothetical protein